MLLNLSQSITDMAGNPIAKDGHTVTLGTLLATILDTTKELPRSDAARLARICHAGGTVTLSEADIDALTKVVASTPFASNVIASQVESALQGVNFTTSTVLDMP